jgi:hypothetical protein
MKPLIEEEEANPVDSLPNYAADEDRAGCG